MEGPGNARLGHIAKGGRDIIVGDVHGHFDVLDALLGDLEIRPGRDRVLSLGDLIDRGPQSEQAPKWMEERFDLTLMGNHELMMLDTLRGQWPAQWWHDNGGAWWLEHIASVARRDIERERWVEALAALPYCATIETQRGLVGLVHAAPTERAWGAMRQRIAAGDAHTRLRAVWSRVQHRHGPDPETLNETGREHTGKVDGVALVLTGHTVTACPKWTAENVLSIETGICQEHGAGLSVAVLEGRTLSLYGRSLAGESFTWEPRIGRSGYLAGTPIGDTTAPERARTMDTEAMR